MTSTKRWRDNALLDRWVGYVMPLTTPYLDNGAVDYDGLASNVRRLVAKPGVAGIYVGSAYQEFWTLTTDERKRILEVAFEAAGDDVPVMAGVSAIEPRTARELCDHAEEVGVPLISTWPPLYGPRDEISVMTYFEEVISPLKTSVFLYSTTLSELGFYVNPRMLVRLSEMDQVVAVKEGSFNLTTYLCLLDEIGERLAVSTSLEEYWILGKLLMPEVTPGFLLASRAMYMPTSDQFFPDVLSGNWEAVARYLARQWPLVRAIQSPGFAGGGHPLSIVKRATELMGQAGGPVRAPIPQHTPAAEQAMIGLLREAELLE